MQRREFFHSAVALASGVVRGSGSPLSDTNAPAPITAARRTDDHVNLRIIEPGRTIEKSDRSTQAHLQTPGGPMNNTSLVAVAADVGLAAVV